LAWQQRCNTDKRTLGGLFMYLADEFNELDWAVALTALFACVSVKTSKKIRKSIECQLCI